MDAEQEKILKKFCAKVVEAFKAVWEKLKKLAKTIYGIIFKLPGYKRKVKAAQLKYYQSISGGKSNNWRKMHGLPLARSRI